jgi:hypothetical protein
MGARKYYKDVTEKMNMLQISNRAISEPILDAMQPYIAFQDVDSDLNDIIYSGMVFDEITDTLSNELIDEHTQPSIPIKYIAELKNLNALAKKYDYIMVIDNKTL